MKATVQRRRTEAKMTKVESIRIKQSLRLFRADVTPEELSSSLS